MAWARMAVRWLAGTCLIVGALCTLLLAVSLNLDAAIRGDTFEIRAGSGLLSVLASPGGGRIVPITSDWPAPWVHRPLEEPSWWFKYDRVRGSFVQVGTPVWLLSLGFLGLGAIGLHLTRGPGLVRRLCAGGAPFRVTARSGRLLLLASLLCLLAMTPQADFGMRIGDRHIVSCGHGAIGYSTGVPLPVQPFLSRWYGQEEWRRFVVVADSPRVWWIRSERSVKTHWPSWTGETQTLIPLWPLVVMLGGLGVWICKRTWPRPGHCLRCGYHLAGLGASAPCPECGAKEKPA